MPFRSITAVTVPMGRPNVAVAWDACVSLRVCRYHTPLVRKARGSGKMQPRKPPQRLQYLSAQLQHALLAVHVGHQHEVFIDDAGHALGLVATWDEGVRWMGRRAAEPTSNQNVSTTPPPVSPLQTRHPSTSAQPTRPATPQSTRVAAQGSHDGKLPGAPQSNDHGANTQPQLRVG